MVFSGYGLLSALSSDNGESDNRIFVRSTDFLINLHLSLIQFLIDRQKKERCPYGASLLERASMSVILC